jgi:hypothetical protein
MLDILPLINKNQEIMVQNVQVISRHGPRRTVGLASNQRQRPGVAKDMRANRASKCAMQVTRASLNRGARSVVAGAHDLSSWNVSGSRQGWMVPAAAASGL